MEDRNAPATKGDLLDLKDRLIETMRDVQTETLKAFYGFAESNRQRVAQLEGNQGAVIARIGTLENRMLDLERKLNFPQHPSQ
jgi:hypothetical protein